MDSSKHQFPIDFDSYQPSPEIIEGILLSLEPKDLQSTIRSNRLFASFANDEKFWEKKLRSDLKSFPQLLETIERYYIDVSWKKRYIATTFRYKLRYTLHEGEKSFSTSDLVISIFLKYMGTIFYKINDSFEDRLGEHFDGYFPSFLQRYDQIRLDDNTFSFIFLIDRDYLSENNPDLEITTEDTTKKVNKEEILQYTFREAEDIFRRSLNNNDNHEDSFYVNGPGDENYSPILWLYFETSICEN
jgi:hypothetical protein